MALSGIVTALVAAGFLFAATDASCAYGADEAGVCSMALHTRRYGGALIQTNKVSSASVDPQELALSFSTRINSIESRVTTLEQESSNERTELATGLDALTATVEEVRAGGDGSLEHTTGRVGAAETHINTLTDTVSTQNSELRAEITAVMNDFENLGTTVGQQSGHSLLQAREGDPADPAAMLAEGTEAPAAAAAPAAPAAHAAASTVGQPMNSRVASLEARVATLETDSSTGRDQLTSQLDALTQTVDSIRAGGVTSLSHTISRLTSAEQQIASLDGNRASQQDTAQADIDTLQTSVNGLASVVGQGVSLAQTNANREEPAAAAATTLPLSTRISSLETSVTSLEQASASGRAMLLQGLNSLTDRVGAMRAGGVTSVEFTTGRVTAAEAQLGALEASSTQRNIDLTAAIAAVRASLLSLTGLVGR